MAGIGAVRVLRRRWRIGDFVREIERINIEGVGDGGVRSPAGEELRMFWWAGISGEWAWWMSTCWAGLGFGPDKRN